VFGDEENNDVASAVVPFLFRLARIEYAAAPMPLRDGIPCRFDLFYQEISPHPVFLAPILAIMA
jgi:hypothetical protein